MGKAEGSGAPGVLAQQPPYPELIQTALNIPNVPLLHIIFTSDISYYNITLLQPRAREGWQNHGISSYLWYQRTHNLGQVVSSSKG